MSSTPVRAGIVGYGLGGAVFHGPLLAAEQGVDVVAVVTRDPERQARARRDFPAARIFATADDLWSVAGDLELAVITTANVAHVPHALAALGAGLHVVIDKPLAAGSADGQRVVEAAEAARRVLTVFQNRRWDGDFLTVRQLVERGALGRVARFESRFERWRPEPTLETWRERGAPEEAGGLLFDLGAHLIDQAVALFGPPRQVYAELDERRPSVVVDDDVFVALTHEGGVRSHLWMSAVAAQLGPRFRVLGSSGAYVVGGLDPQEAALVRGERPGHAGWGTVTPDRYGRLGSDDDGSPVPTLPGRYQDFYRGVVAAIRDGAPPPVDPADPVHVLRIMEAARRSSADGDVVAL